MLATTQNARALHMIERNINAATEKVRRIVQESKADDVTVIQNVRVAFPYKFTHVLGATSSFLEKYPEARRIVDDNMRDEVAQDHVGMAIRFAAAAGAFPDWRNEQHMEPICDRIRQLMSDPASAAKYGIALLAMLENTSLVFIPDMEERAKRRGSKDLQFTQVHGMADEEHAKALCKAAAEVFDEGEAGDEVKFANAVDAGVAFIQRIYTPLN